MEGAAAEARTEDAPVAEAEVDAEADAPAEAAAVADCGGRTWPYAGSRVATIILQTDLCIDQSFDCGGKLNNKRSEGLSNQFITEWSSYKQ